MKTAVFEDRQYLRARIVKRGACWIWQNSCMSAGYGAFRKGGTYYLAHRASYMAFKGAIPDGLVVMHTCDTPTCINPRHLRLGTQSDNMHDCARKGRINRPSKKLTYNQECEVRSMVGLSNRKISKLYGVSSTHVNTLRRTL